MDIILQNDAIERIAVLIKERNLIPVFGAGFSMNSRAYDGVVPSGDKATELMKEILLENCQDLFSPVCLFRRRVRPALQSSFLYLSHRI